MKFAQPLWLLAGLFACAALVWRYRRFDARQRTELAKFASAGLIAQLTASVSPARRQFKRVLVIAGVGCLAIALARPLVGFRWEEAKRTGLDVMFAVDTSKSMLAQDVKPDRLTRAKMAVEDLLGKMEGDRVGLVAFAGNSFLQCPLTLDYDAFRQSLDALDTKIIPRGGTDLAAAIHETEAALEGNGNNERILVLLTDGEDLEGNALDAARAAAKNGLKIFTVGVGSANGELIPAVDETGGTQFTKDESGQFVKSHLDETMLKQIAEATGAMYQPLGQQAQGLETIYTQGLAQFTRRELASRMQKVGIERFQWPLALGLLCIVFEPLIGIRRNKRVTKPAATSRPALAASWNRMARPAMAAVAILVTAISASASVGSAEKAFQKGDYTKAEHDYRQAAAKHPDKPELQYNHGAAAYKAGGFDQAAESFAKAMKTDDLTLQQDNYYNLGNTQYRLGQKTEKANAQETIKTWEQSVQSYEAALQLKPDDADAKYNQDLVKRKLEELKKQEQQKQEKQKPDQKDQDQKNQDPKSDQQNQQEKQDQGKQDDQQNQADKQHGNSGQQDKQDDKKDKNQDKQKDQQAKSDANNHQNQPEEKKDSPDKDKSPGQQAKQDQKQQDKPDKGAGQQEKQDQANQKPESKNQNAQAGQKPEDKKKDGQPQPRNPQPQDQGQEMADARPEPGKMSREEAKQLLDSLKSGDRKMPLVPAPRGSESAKNDQPLKDW